MKSGIDQISNLSGESICRLPHKVALPRLVGQAGCIEIINHRKVHKNLVVIPVARVLGGLEAPVEVLPAGIAAPSYHTNVDGVGRTGRLLDCFCRLHADVGPIKDKTSADNNCESEENEYCPSLLRESSDAVHLFSPLLFAVGLCDLLTAVNQTVKIRLKGRSLRWHLLPYGSK